MKFVVFAKYGPDPDRVAGARQAHFAYAERLREHGKLAAGGPLLDDRGTRVGVLLIYEAPSRGEALALVRNDPFEAAKAFGTCDISEWHPRGVDIDRLTDAHRVAHQRGEDPPESRTFVNYTLYTDDAARIAALRLAHWDYARSLRERGSLIMAGPFPDDRGALLVYNARSRQEATVHLERDPFAAGGVFSSCELLEWSIRGVNPDLLRVRG